MLHFPLRNPGASPGFAPLFTDAHTEREQGRASPPLLSFGSYYCALPLQQEPTELVQLLPKRPFWAGTLRR